MFAFLKQYKVHVVLVLFLILNALLDWINGRFWLNDFKVYYSAATEFRNGLNMYGHPFGLLSGFYKYSPFAAWVFVPISYLPYTIAQFAFYVFGSISVIGVFNYCLSFLEKYQGVLSLGKKQLVFFFALLASITHIQREMHLGNINMILLFGLLFVWKNIAKEKYKTAGIVYALVLVFKLHFIVLIPLFFLRKKRMLLAVSFISILILLILPSLYVGWEQNIALLSAWKDTMLMHNAAIEGIEQTIYYISNLYLFQFFFCEVPMVLNIALVGIVAFIVLWFWFVHIRAERIQKNETSFFFFTEFILLLAVVPNITVTDTEHFLFSLPLVISLLWYLFSKSATWIEKVGISFFVFLYGIKINDLIGASAADFYLIHGLLGISNMAIIAWFIFLNYKLLKESKNA